MQNRPRDFIKRQSESVIAEAGSGDKQGRSVIDLSLDVQEQMKNGAHVFVFSPDKWGLSEQVKADSAAKMSLQDFSASNLHDGNLSALYIPNVVSAKKSGLTEDVFENILPGLKKKLTKNGKIIIIENLAADRSAFLKNIQYGAYGLVAEINEGRSYRTKLDQLKMRETPAAEENLFRTGTPFIVELRNKDA
ncbi:hypothetical protein HY969_01070 [Candidatus Kaiserbacteria bacterium]|nr:hypothetical protein [Candidatus Kaiserbacteria bacterium]